MLMVIVTIFFFIIIIRSHSKRKVIVVEMDKCKQRLHKCAKIKCLDDNGDQVCGTDARTYKTICHLKVATCL